MGVPGIEAQIASMGRVWPRFEVVARDSNAAVWLGPLRPLFMTYAVRVVYRAPLAIEMPNLRRMQPMVSIVTPPLRPRRGDPEGQLPHVYYVGDTPLDVALCMFDPESDEWSPSMPLAETTIPWTVDWLASYEGWRATGQWTGGGKHLERADLRGATQ